MTIGAQPKGSSQDLANLRVSRRIQRAFRAECMRQGVPIRATLEEILQAWIQTRTETHK